MKTYYQQKPNVIMRSVRKLDKEIKIPTKSNSINNFLWLTTQSIAEWDSQQDNSGLGITRVKTGGKSKVHFSVSIITKFWLNNVSKPGASKDNPYFQRINAGMMSVSGKCMSHVIVRIAWPQKHERFIKVAESRLIHFQRVWQKCSLWFYNQWVPLVLLREWRVRCVCVQVYFKMEKLSPIDHLM